MANYNTVTGRATNPGSTLTALTPNTGDTFNVKSFPFSDSAKIIDVWAQTATIGVIRIRSPRLHDVAQGIRLRTSLSAARSLIPNEQIQPLQPQDVLIVEGSGGGAETDIYSFSVLYESASLPAAHLITEAEFMARQVNIFGAEVQITSGATAGQYGGSTALNATFDTWKRNVDYAIVGILSDTAGCTVGITGPDTGQTRIGMPMAVEPLQSHDYFVNLARRLNKPLIPVVNAANIGNTLIDAATSSTGATVNFTVICAELSGSGATGLL